MLTKRISRRGLAGLCVIGTLCASTGTTPSAADACTGVPIRPGMSIPNTVDGAPAGTENRRALATSSNYPEAADLVTRLYDEFGFDTVDVGPLSESWRVERDRPAYVKRQNALELKDNLAKAPRTV